MRILRTARRDRQRGAVAVEAAILVPILAMLLFGLAEFALVWRSSNTVAKTARAAAIDASRDVDARTADLEVVNRVASSFGSARDDVVWVMIYRTTSADGRPTPACTAVAEGLASGSAGVQDWCNVYAGPSLSTFGPADFADPGCSGDADTWLCPTDRRSLFGTDERIGVEIRINHDWLVFPMPGGERPITDRAVAALELDLSTAGGTW